jgi:hypothetical protein
MSVLGQPWRRLGMPVGAGEHGCEAGAVVCATISSAPPWRPARDPPADVMANARRPGRKEICSFRGREDGTANSFAERAGRLLQAHA